MSAKSQTARNLAAAFLAGGWSLSGMVYRGAQALGRRPRWLRPLARRVLAAFPAGANPPDHQTVAGFIDADPGFDRAWAQQAVTQRRLYWAVPRMAPAEGPPTGWKVPALATPAALAQWLQLDLPHLDWFADCRLWEAAAPPGGLRHYSYQWRTKRSGKARLLEVPKPRLKAIQRRLLHELLDAIPPHEAAHGTAGAGRWPRTALPTAAKRSCSGSICATSSPPCPPRGSTPCSARPAIPPRWPAS